MVVSINELVEMLIFGQGAILLLRGYFWAEDIRKKCLIMLGFVLCAGGYALSLYPAWMIPFFYAMCDVIAGRNPRDGLLEEIHVTGLTGIRKSDKLLRCGAVRCGAVRCGAVPGYYRMN